MEDEVSDNSICDVEIQKKVEKMNFDPSSDEEDGENNDYDPMNIDN